MNSFQQLLERFDAILRKYNPVNYARLQPPLPQKEIDAYLESFGVGDNEELKLLFSWKNGFNFLRGEDSHFQIFDYGALLSLEHLTEYAKYAVEPEFDDNEQRLFLQLTTNGGGECLLYNIRENGFGKIYVYDVSLFIIDEPLGYYDSLSAMIETTIQAYEQSIFTYKETDDWLDKDIDKYYKLAREINTKSDYWKEE